MVNSWFGDSKKWAKKWIFVIDFDNRAIIRAGFLKNEIKFFYEEWVFNGYKFEISSVKIRNIHKGRNLENTFKKLSILFQKKYNEDISWKIKGFLC